MDSKFVTRKCESLIEKLARDKYGIDIEVHLTDAESVCMSFSGRVSAKKKDIIDKLNF